MQKKLGPEGQFLLFCLLLVYGMYVMRRLEPGYTFAKYDPGWMVFTVMSIVDDGDLDLRNQLQNNPKNTADQTSRGLKGQWYPLHEYMMAYLCVPFYITMGIIGCLIFNVLISIALMMLLYDLCCQYMDRKIGFIAVALTSFGTLFLNYTYSFSLDVFGAFILVIAYRTALGKNIALSGFVWGIAVLGRTANIVTAPAFGLYVLWCAATHKGCNSISRKPIIRKMAVACGHFMLGMMPALLLMGVANWKMYGKPWIISYSRWQHFIEGKFIISSQGNAFTASLRERIPLVLFDRKEGLFSGDPLLIFALAFGLLPLWQRSKKEAFLLTMIILSFIILYSKYTPWNMGGGNRYLMPVMALGAVPLGFAIKKAFSRSKEEEF